MSAWRHSSVLTLLLEALNLGELNSGRGVLGGVAGRRPPAWAGPEPPPGGVDPNISVVLSSDG